LARSMTLPKTFPFVWSDLGVGPLEGVLRIQGPGQLALVALLVADVVPVQVGGERRLRGGGAAPASGSEEPELVLEDGPAEGGFVGGDDLVRALVVRIRGEVHPVVVLERGAERAAEVVAAGLRDRVHDAPLEAPELRGHGRGRDRGLLEGVLDEELLGLPADVVV